MPMMTRLIRLLAPPRNGPATARPSTITASSAKPPTRATLAAAGARGAAAAVDVAGRLVGAAGEAARGARAGAARRRPGELGAVELQPRRPPRPLRSSFDGIIVDGARPCDQRHERPAGKKDGRVAGPRATS